MRECKKCGEVLPLEEFPPRHYRNGIQVYRYACKPCFNEQARAAYASRPRAHKDNRAIKLKMQYGMTQEDFDSLLTAQGGRCAICQSEDPNSRWGTFYVDHNHETGAVRGLLCSPCNTGLGMFKDNLANLKSALAYLGKYDPDHPMFVPIARTNQSNN